MLCSKMNTYLKLYQVLTDLISERINTVKYGMEQKMLFGYTSQTNCLTFEIHQTIQVKRRLLRASWDMLSFNFKQFQNIHSINKVMPASLLMCLNETYGDNSYVFFPIVQPFLSSLPIVITLNDNCDDGFWTLHLHRTELKSPCHYTQTKRQSREGDHQHGPGANPW